MAPNACSKTCLYLHLVLEYIYKINHFSEYVCIKSDETNLYVCLSACLIFYISMEDIGHYF